MQTVFRSYSDPGHGWAKVPKKLLRELQIADKITTHSYMRGEFAFLEEDCDLSTFHKAMEARGITPKYKGSCTAYARSKIRSYSFYYNEQKG